MYAICNKRYNQIYIGQTIDLRKRIKEHNEKVFKTSFTAQLDGKRKLVYKEVVYSWQKALKRKKQPKSYRGREFIKSN